MRLAFWIAIVLVLGAACSATTSGIEGIITAGPACPVTQAGVPCPDPPYPGTLTILAENGQTRVATVTADDSGYYKVLLEPGTYIIHPESPGILPRAGDVVVVVLPDRFTPQDIVYDTGIR